MRSPSIVILGILVAGAAVAQTAQNSATQPSLAGNDIAEIVVTAMKVDTSLQRTPAAVTVISGSALEQQGIDTIQGIQNVVPSAHLGTVEDLQERGAAAFIFGRDREPRFNYGLVRSQR